MLIFPYFKLLDDENPYKKTDDGYDYFTDRRSRSSMRHMTDEFARVHSKISQKVNYYRETSPRIDSYTITKDDRDTLQKCGMRRIHESDCTIDVWEIEYLLEHIHGSEIENMYDVDFYKYPHDNLDEYKDNYIKYNSYK